MTDQAVRSELIAALRKVADVLEADGGIPVPYFGTQVIRCESVEDFRKIISAFGGYWVKESSDNDFQMTCQLGGSLALLAYASHEKVCERVVVGTKHVPETILPAQPERVVPARVEEVVKWVCPSILGDTEPLEPSPIMSDNDIPF